MKYFFLIIKVIYVYIYVSSLCLRVDIYTVSQQKHAILVLGITLVTINRFKKILLLLDSAINLH